MNNVDVMTLLILKTAREILSQSWTKTKSAVNRAGTLVDVTSKNAVRFNAWGALMRVGGLTVFKYEAEELLMKHLPPWYNRAHNIGAFEQDPRTEYKDVLALFDAAIQEIEHGKQA